MAYAKANRQMIRPLMLSSTAAYLDRINLGFATLQTRCKLGVREIPYRLAKEKTPSKLCSDICRATSFFICQCESRDLQTMLN